jgi:hypothetical protein
VVADQVHGGSRLAYSGWQVEHSTALAAVEQLPDPLRSEALMSEQAIGRFEHGARRFDGLGSPLDQQTVEAKELVALLRIPRQAA